MKLYFWKIYEQNVLRKSLNSLINEIFERVKALGSFYHSNSVFLLLGRIFGISVLVSYKEFMFSRSSKVSWWRSLKGKYFPLQKKARLFWMSGCQALVWMCLGPCTMVLPVLLENMAHKFIKKIDSLANKVRETLTAESLKVAESYILAFKQLGKVVEIFLTKSDKQVWSLRSSRSYFNVICVIRHNMTFYVIWGIWHRNMTSVNLADLVV